MTRPTVNITFNRVYELQIGWTDQLSVQQDINEDDFFNVQVEARSSMLQKIIELLETLNVNVNEVNAVEEISDNYDQLDISENF